MKVFVTGTDGYIGCMLGQMLLERGHDVYTYYCASCHGARGDGQGPAGTGMAVRFSISPLEP